jgi:CDP-glycerol glycerophosphotransferase (TagB/SpsB family)
MTIIELLADESSSNKFWIMLLALISLKPSQLLFQFFDFITPKKKRLIVIGSNAGKYASGSPGVLDGYIRRKHPEYEVEYYLPFRESDIRKTVIYIIKFIPRMLSARMLIFSHGPYDFYPFFWWSNRKKSINFWHGIPLKSMAFDDPEEDKKHIKLVRKMNSKTTFFIVSSKLEEALMAKCFLIDPSKFRCLGQPRNDVLLNQDNPERIKPLPIDMPENEMLVLYAPTWRRYSETEFFPFDDFDLDDLNEFLKEHKMVLLLRGHVSEKGNQEDLFSTRIIDSGFDVCENVYPLLNSIDLLITDYSSIYLDFLLLDRPCMFIPYDVDLYRIKRGFLLEDYEDWTPGPKIHSYEDFKKSLLEIKNGIDQFGDERNRLRKIFHSCQTDETLENIVSLIEETITPK